MTRSERTASWGTLPEPNDMPSMVMLFAVGRCPATEKAVAVESLPRQLLGIVIPVAPARPRAVAPRAGARADGDGVERHRGQPHANIGHDPVLVRLAGDIDLDRRHADEARRQLVAPT